LGKNFTFLYSCCNANSSRAGVQSTILLAVVVWLMQQFHDFIHTCANGELENFSVADDCLDTFLRNRMAANYPKAWSVCELALLLSHGQASVKGGFLVSKKLVVENQSEQTLSARRIIKDHIIHVNGVNGVGSKCQS